MRIIEREEERYCVDCDTLLGYTEKDIVYSYYSPDALPSIEKSAEYIYELWK